VEELCGGKAQKPRFSDEAISVIKWVDGTLIDTVFRVESEEKP